MKKIRYCVAAFVLTILPGSYLALAQQNGSPQHAMTFFVTSVGLGQGANLGGLAGADWHCQVLATAVGAGDHTWHAHLSTRAKNGEAAINARDRIGPGPWYNAEEEMIARDLAELHGDTIELARLGSNLNRLTALTEQGEFVPGLSENPKCPGPGCNEHEMLTGLADGWPLFCRHCRPHVQQLDEQHRFGRAGTNSWEEAQIGFSDRNGGTNGNWNSSHPTRGCSQKAIACASE